MPRRPNDVDISKVLLGSRYTSTTNAHSTRCESYRFPRYPPACPTGTERPCSYEEALRRRCTFPLSPPSSFDAEAERNRTLVPRITDRTHRGTPDELGLVEGDRTANRFISWKTRRLGPSTPDRPSRFDEGRPVARRSGG